MVRYGSLTWASAVGEAGVVGVVFRRTPGGPRQSLITNPRHSVCISLTCTMLAPEQLNVELFRFSTCSVHDILVCVWLRHIVTVAFLHRVQIFLLTYLLKSVHLHTKFLTPTTIHCLRV